MMPERMRVLLRVLLVALGATESPSQNGMTAWMLINDDLGTPFTLTLNGWIGESKRSWFILACAVWLDSEAVKAKIYVEHNNGGLGGIDPHTAFWPKDDCQMMQHLFGPFGVRVVAAAAEVAGMMGGERK